MTENEAIEEIKKKICGERPTQHICSDGCMKGNDKCALSVAIKALEEVQQYRAIGTVEELKSLKENGAFTGEELAQLAAMQMWLRDYEKIGTVDECRAAVDKQTAKRPKEYEDKYYACPVCGNVLLHKWEKYPDKLMDKSNGLPYCLGCGQHLDWSDEE